MRRFWLIAVATFFLAGLFAGMRPSGAIGLQDPDVEATRLSAEVTKISAEATIGALRSEATIIALHTEVAQLQTQVATLSPTPTATPALLPTVAAEPQMLTEGLELLYYYTIENRSSATLLGEVRNTTDQRIDAPYLEITLLDAEGNITAVTNARPALVTVDSGETVPFEASVSEIGRDEWHHEEIRVCEWRSDFYVDEGYGASPTLQLQEVEELEKSSDRLEIEGKVLNSGNTHIDQVEVKAFVYLPDGRYAGEASVRIDVPIPAGKTARFNLDGWSYDIPGLDLPETGDDYTYRLWAGTEPGARVYSC